MAGPDPDEECGTLQQPDLPEEPEMPEEPGLPDGCPAGLHKNMTLENILDLTGEVEHLNDLVMLTLDKEGGFTCTEAYFKTVQPVLDLLEVEIRCRCRPGMSRDQMKLIIQDFIDSEIRELQ